MEGGNSNIFIFCYHHSELQLIRAELHIDEELRWLHCMSRGVQTEKLGLAVLQLTGVEKVGTSSSSSSSGSCSAIFPFVPLCVHNPFFYTSRPGLFVSSFQKEQQPSIPEQVAWQFNSYIAPRIFNEIHVISKLSCFSWWLITGPVTTQLRQFTICHDLMCDWLIFRPTARVINVSVLLRWWWWWCDGAEPASHQPTTSQPVCRRRDGDKSTGTTLVTQGEDFIYEMTVHVLLKRNVYINSTQLDWAEWTSSLLFIHPFTHSLPPIIWAWQIEWLAAALHSGRCAFWRGIINLWSIDSGIIIRRCPE